MIKMHKMYYHKTIATHNQSDIYGLHIPKFTQNI